MARKNTPKNDSSSITFNTRTKAVMADVVQDNIKEKVNAVREVVCGKSNNEIVLVLQYYDYNVEKTIQAYYEDGAKSALTEWHFSGTKQTVKKKKNKKPKQTQNSTSAPKSPQSVSSDTGSTASLRVNGDISAEPSGEHLVNGNMDFDTDHPVKVKEPIKNHILAGQGTASSHNSQSPKSSGQSHPTQNGISEGNKPTPLPQRDASKSASPDPQSLALPQRLSHPSHGQRQRQRTHSGSHSHTHGSGNRNRTVSTASNASSTAGADQKSTSKKAVHAGLEKSVKDLHRQTVSLERLRFVFDEEVERAYKRIKTVFDEIRTCLTNREMELVRNMDKTRDIARETFNMRQNLAAELKVQIDRAERMNEAELANLRTEIKHFVSDRKIDEDLGKTTRFMYDSDHLIAEIQGFGEIVPVKRGYITNRPLSPVDTKSHDTPVPTKQPPKDKRKVISADTGKQSVSASETNRVTHLGPAEAHELAELQRRLKHSLNLGGIATETYPDRPSSAPFPSETNQTGVPPGARGDSANSRRNRNRRRLQERQDDQGPNRPSYPQGQRSGERVVLIGRGTRPQTSSSGPQRGRGRGRGRGGYRGRGRGGFRDIDGPLVEYTPKDLENPMSVSTKANGSSSPQRHVEKNESRNAKPSRSPRNPRNVTSPRGQGQGQGRNEGSSGSAESKASQPVSTSVTKSE